MNLAKTKYLCAMTLFGTIGIFVRYIPMSSSAIAFYRGVLGCCYLLLVMLMIVALAVPAYAADDEIIINFPSVWVGTDSKAPYMAQLAPLQKICRPPFAWGFRFPSHRNLRPR